MSASDFPANTDPSPRPRVVWSRTEAMLVRIGDRLNPILVKETRQALKSRQFLVSFGLVLLACWLWSIAGAAMIGPAIYYRASGAELFYGYYLILWFPLAVVVPFFTYRSLSAESEEDTYELLSITTLSPRQIVSGKLGSAAIQIVIYLSAVAPCLAFTYLLRGIDVLSIGVFLVYTVLASLGLSMIGLLLATITREKYAQVVLTVGIVLGLFWVFVAGTVAAQGFLQWGSTRVLHDKEFWIFTAGLATAYATYFALGFLAAAARVTFATENRSTPLRIAMLVQYACFAGWMAWPWLETKGRGHREVLEVFMVVVAVHWYVMGVLMTGESPALSVRVKRDLPRSFLGRAFLTWFSPGPGTGYMFAIGSLLGALVLVGIAAFLGAGTGPVGPPAARPAGSTVVLAILLWSYVTAFLGLGRFVLAAIRRLVPSTDLLHTTVVHVALVGLCTAVPLCVQFSSTRWRLMGYTSLQMSNPFWTVAAAIDRRGLPDATVVLGFVCCSAVVVLLLNLPSIVAEVRHVRVAAPERVIEEETARRPPPREVKTSPWG